MKVNRIIVLDLGNREKLFDLASVVRQISHFECDLSLLLNGVYGVSFFWVAFWYKLL